MSRYKSYGKGWHYESTRHSLAAKGIKTGFSGLSMAKKAPTQKEIVVSELSWTMGAIGTLEKELESGKLSDVEKEDIQTRLVELSTSRDILAKKLEGMRRRDYSFQAEAAAGVAIVGMLAEREKQATQKQAYHQARSLEKQHHKDILEEQGVDIRSPMQKAAAYLLTDEGLQ
jgi:hypothetical protein